MFCLRSGPWFALLLTLSAVQASASAPADVTAASLRADKQDGENVVRSIRARGAVVEVELYSSTGFPVRSERPILLVGEKEFTRSKYAAEGDGNTVVFIIPDAEFAALADGEEVTIKYGTREPPSARKRFGKLNKALLSRA